MAVDLGGRRVATDQLVEWLRQRHPEYADPDLAVPWPPRQRTATVDAWLDDIAALWLPLAHDPLHGRAVIVGAALLDKDAGRAMIESGLFWSIAREMHPPLAQAVNDSGAAHLAGIPIAAAIGGQEPEPVAGSEFQGSVDVAALAFDSEGRILSAQSSTGEVTVWRDGVPSILVEDDATTGGLVRGMRARVAGQPEVWSPDGRRRLWLEDGTVRVSDPTGAEVASFGETVDRFWLSDDGQTVAAWALNAVEVWDVDTGRAVVAASLASPDAVVALTGDRLAVASGNEALVGGREVLGTDEPITALAWRPDGELLAVGDRGGFVTLWQAGTQAVVGRILHPSSIQALAFSTDGRTLVAGGGAGGGSPWRSNVAFPRRRRVATYDADTAPGDRDLLDIDNDVEAFASLIAARNLVPPLSIGLFGNWGSGKSFFMQRLRRRVQEIGREARTSGRVQQDVDFYKYIVQIDFNAWHYVEGNLWASLVQHIFENLRVDDELDSMTALAKRESRLLRKAEEKLQAVTAEVDVAQVRLDQSRARVEALRREHDQQVRKLEEEQRREVLRATVDQGVSSLVRRAIEPFGLKPLSDAAQDLRDSLSEARREAGGLAPNLRVLVDPVDPESKELRRGLVTKLVVAAVVALLLGGLVYALSAGGLAGLSGLVSGLAGVLYAVSRWAQGMAGWLAERRADMDKAGAELQTAIDAERKRQTKELATLRADETRAAAELQAAIGAREEARADVERRLLDREVPPARLLGRLIQTRLESGDYRKHLGVLALIRQDFSDAADIVAESNRWLETNEDLESETTEDRVDRIVLYIDDLDRCPPRRVVEVLEAVHLLLAFPLFVVVVGVDPRWVKGALQAHYWQLLASEDGQPAASPVDYIEKIFQVPFQLGDMTEGTTRRMLAGLVPLDDAAPVGVGGEGPQPVGGPVGGGQTSAGGATSSTDGDRGDGPRNLTPGSLQIERAELETMQALGPLLGTTPRTTKRFVNIYRILKVRAQDRPQFLRDRGPASEYKVVMFLLAVTTGLPDLAPAFYAALESSTGGKVRDLGLRPGEDRDRLQAWFNRPEGGPWADLPVTAVTPFTADVRRFSFILEG